LAEKSSLFNQKEAAVAYFDSAAIYLNILQDNEADSGWAEKAYYLLTQIELMRLITPDNRRSKLLELKIEWQNRFPESRFLDFILIRFADSIMATSSEDTAQIQLAINSYRTILKNFPESSYYEEAQYQEAVALHHLGSDSVAMQKLIDFVDSNPRSHFLPNALFLIAKLEKKNVNYTSAIQYLERILTEFYYSSLVTPAQLELAEIYFQMGKFQSAIDYYQSIQSSRNAALAMDGKYKGYAIIFKEAQAYESLGQYSNALKKYITFVHENPEHALSLQGEFAIARISQNQKNLNFAKEYYQNILKHSTQSEYQYEAHLSLGDIFFQQELYEEANSHYLTAQKMASELPQEKYPASQSIRCKYKLKQFKAADADAKMFMKKFKDSKPEEAQFLQDKGNAYIAEKKFDLAEKTFKKLKDNFKNTEFAARGEFGLGAVYLITNHTEEALKLLTNIPSKYPESEVVPLTYFNLGDFYYKSQQIENAINAFKQILGHPKAGDFYQKALNYLIKSYSDLKLWDQAIALTREYLNKYPTSKDSFNKKVELAKFLMYLKEYNRAIARFKQLQPFADDETYTEIQFYIGQSYNEMGNFNRAASEYLKVKYLTRPTKLPWHVTAQFEASKCLIRLGKTEQAKIILQRIITEQGVDSNFGRFAKQKLEEIEKANSPIVEKDTY
ncbi:MAG: tetratricopeptide repeat protein, partial [bacterium]